MKKKNLFVGLLLASAAFSLAACTSNPKKPTTTTTKEVPVTTDKPAESTSGKPAESTTPDVPTSTTPDVPTSTTPTETTTVEERELISFSIDSENVKKEYTVGDKIDLTGLVVKANYNNGDIETVTDYELKVLNGDTEVALDAELTAGTYTISVKVGDKKAKTFEVVCKVEQYKYTLPIIVDDYVDYLDSMDINVESSYTIPKDTKLIENESFSIDATTDGVIIQRTDSNNNPVAKEYDGVTYDTRIQVNGSSKVIVFTAKADGKLDILYQTSSERYIAVKDDSSPAIITSGEAVTDETKDVIHEMTVDIVSGKKYTIYSSEKGSNVYAMYFNGSVDASTRIATNEFYFWPTVTEFDIVDNKFDPTAIDAVIEAKDNYGVVRDVDFNDCAVTIKDSSNQPVDGEITVAGTYTVTVEYDGKEVTFEISVSDPNSAVTALILDTDSVIKTFYEGDTFDYNGLTVEGQKGAVNISLTAEEYTVELLKGTDVVTAFSTEGDYTVRVTYNEDTNVTSTYTIKFYTISKVEYTAPTALNVKIGTNDFYIPGLKAIATYGDETTKDVTDNVEIEFNRDDESVTAAEAFATAGEVDVVVRYMNHAIPAAIAVTVKAFEATDYNFEAKTATTGGSIATGTEIISNTDFKLINKGIKADYLKDFSTATATDGTTFNMAVVTTGGMDNDKVFEFTALNDTYVTIYFTITDSKFVEKDQAKSGELMINNEEVVTVKGSKSNTIAYSYTVYVAKDQTISFRAASNRLALFGLKVEQ